MFQNELAKLKGTLSDIQKDLGLANNQNRAISFSAKGDDWEAKARIIIYHFQRFIEYAVSAAPNQAEFLLSLQSLNFDQYKPKDDDPKIADVRKRMNSEKTLADV